MRTVQDQTGLEAAAHLGMRVRHRRWMLGIRQAELTRNIGIQVEALQAFERGELRLGLVEL